MGGSQVVLAEVASSLHCKGAVVAAKWARNSGARMVRGPGRSPLVAASGDRTVVPEIEKQGRPILLAECRVVSGSFTGF